MFYHTLVLGRKGPLAKVWLAATYRKKLSKKDIINVNVAESVEAILCSRVLMSLRLSSHLLYGISYLFNQQVSYLLSDALQYAYHVPQFIEEQGIDLLDQSTRDINLSDDNLDYELIPESCGAAEFKIINATKTRILGDLAEVISEEFESLDVLRNDNLLNESIHTDEILFEDRVFTDDGFGGNLDQDPTTVFDIHAPSTSKAAKKRSGRSQEPVQDERQENIEEHHPTVDDNITENIENLGAGPDIVVDFFDLPTQPTPAPDVQEDHPEQPSDEALNVDNLEPVAGPSMEQARRPSTSRYSRLELNDEELVLEPLDESHKRAKRKKANIVLIDEVTSIPRARMMGNFRDASETSGRERAPSTKFLMMTKASGTDTVLLNNPSTKYVSSIALALFKSCLKMESDSNDDDDDLLPTQDANPTDAAPDQEIPNEELPSVLFEEEINDLPPPDIPEEPIPEVPVVEQEKATESEPTARVGLKEPVPESQSSQPSQERGSQRRRKRRRLSQEQARRGTIYEPEILPRESIIEFEKTHMDVDPPEEEVPLFSQSQSEFSSTPEEGILSQLSQSLSEPVSFSQLTQDCNRKKAALTFFQLLALHKRCVIILAQEQYYEEIYISKGPNFRGTLDVY